MTRAALYRHFDASGSLLYVGVTRDPISRTNTHATKAAWYESITRIEIEWFGDRETACAAEAAAIQAERPIHNKTLGYAFPERLPAGPMTLRQFAAEVGVSGSAIAASVGLSQAYVSELLSCTKRPSLATAFKIERATSGAVPVSAWAAPAPSEDVA